MNDIFHKFAHQTSVIVGSPWAFMIAAITLIIWAITGPVFHFSDTWQLIINTGTTIITFLMVFLIQNTQNRETKAINLKLDELIHATKKARNKVMGLENMSDEDLKKITEEIEKIGQKRKKK